MITALRYERSTGKVVSKLKCLAEFLPDQASDEFDVIPYDPAIHPHPKDCVVVDGQILEKDQTAKDDQLYQERVLTFPDLDFTLTDAELNQFISDYYLGRVDPVQWRLEHYEILRKKIYPPIEEFIDAMVKIKSKDDPDLGKDEAKEGEDQLKQYVKDCYAVKDRFPKE